MYKSILDTIFNLTERMKRHKTMDIARASGVHRNTVRSIKNGVNKNPSVDTLNAIHKALDSMEGVEHD
ncbi:MAG: hypothetical protein Tp136SUR676911_20 [Prokaryotic dsDNA virus sp.]|nr:MAG: hypothetical protein Tp136SUR676911_20 [Prokaryotic dsDNA virus sp.]